MTLVVPVSRRGYAVLTVLGAGNRCSGRATPRTQKAPLHAPHRLETVSESCSRKLPWFAMVLVTFGECWGCHNSSLEITRSSQNVRFVLHFFSSDEHFFAEKDCSESCIPVFEWGKSKAVCIQKIQKRFSRRLWSSLQSCPRLQKCHFFGRKKM